MKHRPVCAILSAHNSSDAAKRMKIDAIQVKCMNSVNFVRFGQQGATADCILVNHLFSIEAREEEIREFKRYNPHCSIMGFVSDFYPNVMEQMRRFEDLIDVYVVPTVEMQINMSCFVDSEVVVIPDPIDFHLEDSVEKLHVQKRPMDVLWYGYRESFDRSMLEFSPLLEWMHETLQIRYHIVTNVAGFGHRDNVLLHQYDLDTFPRLLPQFDLCILSHVPNDFQMATYSKSNNKATLAINRGVPVIASRTPSYQQLLEECGLSEYLFVSRRELEIAINKLSDADKRNRYLKKSQGVVLEKYSATQVAKKWLELFNRERTRLR